MIPTKPSDDIHDFLDFLRFVLGADAARKRKGAAPEEIQRFVELARLPLPKLYLGYLREFGENDAGLEWGDDSDTKLSTLLSFYARIVGKAPSHVLESGVKIAVNGLGGDIILLYSQEAKRGSEEPRVVSWDDEIEPIAASFRNLLYRSTFSKRRSRGNAVLELDTLEDVAMSDILYVATELEFQPYWFNDDCAGWLERDDQAALFIRKREGAYVYGEFPDERTRDAVQKYLVECVDLRPVNSQSEL